MLYIDSDLKSYTVRENRAEWLNKLIDIATISVMSALSVGAFLLVLCSLYAY